jgi:hypothetical protein
VIALSRKINPLNVLDCREVLDPPPYFYYHYIDIKRYDLSDTIREWIYDNLKYRFYIGETLVLENNQFKIKTKIGFEEPKELSFFLLACSHLTDLSH